MYSPRIVESLAKWTVSKNYTPHTSGIIISKNVTIKTIQIWPEVFLEWKVVVICMHSINMLRIAHISPREGL
jgi:hypothetical protein